MRIPSYALALVVVAGSVALVSAPKNTRFTIHDQAYYAPQATVEYVNPGLVFTIVSAKIASDGTISMDYKLTDPQGLPLDSTGIHTPGAISPRYLSPTFPKAKTQFSSYITVTVSAITGGATAPRQLAIPAAPPPPWRRRIHLYL